MKKFLLICSFIFLFSTPLFAQDASKWYPALLGTSPVLERITKSSVLEGFVDIKCNIAPSRLAKKFSIDKVPQVDVYFKYLYQRNGHINEGGTTITKGREIHNLWYEWKGKCGPVPWSTLEEYFTSKK